MSSTSSKTWLHLFIGMGNKPFLSASLSCNQCIQPVWPTDYAYFVNPPPYLTLDIKSQIHPTLIVSNSFNLPSGPPNSTGSPSSISYTLAGIIYHRANHFTTGLCADAGQTWYYDGLEFPVAMLEWTNDATVPADLLSANGGLAILLVYAFTR